jgi:hypothetical protein
MKEANDTKILSRKKMSAKEREDVLIENFVGLQKAMMNLSIKFENLSDNISKLLNVFELSAKDYLANKGKSSPEIDRDLTNKINLLLEQNKSLTRVLMNMDDKLRQKPEYRPQPQQQQTQTAQFKPKAFQEA